MPPSSPTAHGSEAHIVVEFPLETVSEMNARDHHMARHRRRTKQWDAVGWQLVPHKAPPSGPVTITLIRIRRGGRKMDGDNLQSCFKFVRDAIARWLSTDDGDDRLRWEYAQEVGAIRGIRIEVSA